MVLEKFHSGWGWGGGGVTYINLDFIKLQIIGKNNLHNLLWKAKDDVDGSLV